MFLKKYFFIFLMPVLLLQMSCNNDVVRRLSFRNEPALVAEDMAKAMQKGRLQSLFALSEPSVEAKLCNELLLSAAPGQDLQDLLNGYSRKMKTKYHDTEIIIQPLAQQQNDKSSAFFLITFKKQDGSGQEITVHLIKNESGSWKNITRL